MRVAFTLNLRRYPSGHQLHEELRDLGFADGGFIPPRFGFNRRFGFTNYNQLFLEATRLDTLCPPWVPFVIDYEKAYRWIRHGDPDEHGHSPPITPEQSYDLIRNAALFMRQSFPLREVADWGRPALWTKPISDRLGNAFTCACPITNRKTEWDDKRWWAVRNQEYNETLTWRMPINLWVTNYSWSPARPLNDAEWGDTVDFVLEREPDYTLYSGAGSVTQIISRAASLIDSLAGVGED